MKRKAAAANISTKRARVEMKQNRRDAVKNPAIVEINCSDNLSLFRAVRVGMFYYEKGGGKWESAEHHVRSSRLSNDAVDLWILVGGTLQQTTYGLDDIKKVYKNLEKMHPRTYRILVFSEASRTQTIYNSGINAKHNICLYYRDGHFDLMKTPQKFLRKRHYCVDCEKTYENQADHTKCKIRCRKCFRIGYGYPCKGEESKTLECPDCRKFFPSQDCMNAHKPYSCSTYHRCVYCDVEHRVRPKLENKGHRCSKKVADIAARTLLTVPAHLEKDKFDCATTANTRLTRYGLVQQSILSYMTREVTVF